MAVESSRHCVCSVACFPLLSDRLQRLTGLSESSSASAQAAQAGSQTKGVVSLAHSLLFGCLWQQDPNNLDMWLCLKKKKTGNGTQSRSLGHSVGGRAAVSSGTARFFPPFFLKIT